MAESNDSDNEKLTSEDMRLWLRDEVRRVMKNAELQIKDATDFVTAYAAGTMSPAEADARMALYDSRWGESRLIAAMPREGMTDEEILRNLDSDVSESRKDWAKILREKRTHAKKGDRGA